MLIELMNTQFQVWAMESEKAVTTRERALFLADQQALFKADQDRRDKEYRSAVFGDIRYWGWAALLVALLAAAGGWWLRGVVAPASAKQGNGTFSLSTSIPSN